MKISVIEAMRLKNELHREIGKLQYSHGMISYGETYEGGERIDNQAMKSIVEHLEGSEKLLEMSLEINDALDQFNKDNAVSTMIRKIKNNDLLLSMWNNALASSEPKKGIKRVKLDNKIENVEYEFKPFATKTEVRKLQKAIRAENRELQSKIDKANSQMIQLTFEYNEFEDLRSMDD